MKINGPRSDERGEDRFVQALVWKAMDAGWGEGEACAAIASLADHHVLAMQCNDIVSGEIAEARGRSAKKP
jgi:hypothetical protein